jgi:hypothetical protein
MAQVTPAITKTFMTWRTRSRLSFGSRSKVDLRRSHTRTISYPSGPFRPSFLNRYTEVYYRASRQRLLLAARNLSMICVPEGVRCFYLDLVRFLSSDFYSGHEPGLGPYIYC